MRILRKLSRLLRDARKLGPFRGSRYLVLVVLGRLLAWSDRHAEDFTLPGTGKAELLSELDIESENREFGFAYVATPSILFTTLMSNLPKDLSEYSFVDFGSGKGNVLLLAARHGFGQIIGVEFATELHEFAAQNIAEASRHDLRTEHITCVHGDACELPIPEGKCVLYFNNPFSEPVMRRVLGNIEASCLQDPRKIYILYQQLLPELEDDPTENLAILDAARFLKNRKARFPSLASRIRLAPFALKIYETVES